MRKTILVVLLLTFVFAMTLTGGQIKKPDSYRHARLKVKKVRYELIWDCQEKGTTHLVIHVFDEYGAEHIVYLDTPGVIFGRHAITPMDCQGNR
jgi:hypothetical protein